MVSTRRQSKRSPVHLLKKEYSMQSIGCYESIRWHLFTALLALVTLPVLSGKQAAYAQERLSQPAPRTAPNGAIHYQRAILFLTAVEPDKRRVLQQPIWEIITPETTDAEIAELNKLLIESRHAIRSALVGSNQANADFGLDVRQYMVSALLPHPHAMVDLSRLIALVGIHRESEQRWRESADLYLSAVRMGRHMTHQTTLAEAYAGVEILETAYFCLGRWATKCPDRALVEEAFDLLTVATLDVVQPARTMQSEANILQQRMDALRASYPDGPWAEIVIETLGADFPLAGPEGMRAAAKAAAIEYGVPEAAFSSKESLLKYLDEISSVHIGMASETVHCLTQPAAEAIRRGEKIASKYQGMRKTQNTINWEPAKIASLFAIHEAELSVLRLTMAVAAGKSSAGYPSDLSAVADMFGGKLPNSPYDGSPLGYEVTTGNKDFVISVNAAKIGSVDLPEIKFGSAAH